MATARELFDDYNWYRAHTGNAHVMRERGEYFRFLRETPEKLAALARMAAWCAEREYDPRHWLCWLFYRAHWRWARPFHQLIPGSKQTAKKMLVAYAQATTLPMFNRRLRQVAQTSHAYRAEVYDGNRDMAATTEALKRRYLRMDDPDGCMGDERSNGYHPRSLVCARCVLAQECERRLQSTVVYDIVALREGKITAGQARMEVATRG